MYLLAVFLPPLVFFNSGKPWQGLLNGLVWLTCCGAPFATAWAFFEAGQYLDDCRTRAITRAIHDSEWE